MMHIVSTQKRMNTWERSLVSPFMCSACFFATGFRSAFPQTSSVLLFRRIPSGTDWKVAGTFQSKIDRYLAELAGLLIWVELSRFKNEYSRNVGSHEGTSPKCPIEPKRVRLSGPFFLRYRKPWFPSGHFENRISSFDLKRCTNKVLNNSS